MSRLKTIIFVLLGITLLLTSLITACTPASEKVYTMRFATSHSPTAPHVMALKELESTILEETNGRVKFEVYGGGQLYTDDVAFAAVKEGSLESCMGGMYLAPISPEFNLLAAGTFLFDDREHYYRFAESDFFESINTRLEENGVTQVGEIMVTFTQIFNSVRPIEKLEDLNGLKIRIAPTPLVLESLEALNIQHIAIDSAEVVSALETGMIDGLVAILMATPAMGLDVRTPYLNVCNMICVPYYVAVNAKWWNSLPNDLQKTLTRIFEEKAKSTNETTIKFEDNVIAQYKAKSGNVVTYLSDQERNRWLEKVRPVWEKEMASDSNIKKMVETIDSLR